MVWVWQNLQLIGVGVVGLVLVVMLAPVVLPWLVAKSAPRTPAERDEDELTAEEIDQLDMKALRRLQARFERLGCVDGQAAIDTCAREFFVEHHRVAPSPSRPLGYESEVRS